MELDLDRQEPGRSEIDISGTLELGMGESGPMTADVSGVLVVQNIESRCLLNGRLEAVGDATCGRCLNDFSLVWTVPVDMMVLRDVDSDEDEGETLLIQQRTGVVDLRESIRESAVLGFPLVTVCREDCKGLCPTCGIDLNEEVCSCADEDYDPRWEGLPE